MVSSITMIDRPAGFPNHDSPLADAIHYYNPVFVSLQPVPPTPLNLQAKVKALFSIHQFKLFHRDGDYVAFYGEPSATDDGWIINLPASQVFEGDYHALRFETDLDAIWVQTQAQVKAPLAAYLCRNSPATHWATKLANAGVPNYQHADIFRDIASVLIDAGQHHLALEFIKKAHSLRPTGPVILQMLNDLQTKCSSDQ